MCPDAQNKSNLYSNAPEPILKILKDPHVHEEVKDLCFRLLQNPYTEFLLNKTPISSIFEICEEYKKHADIYDEIFCGQIKFFLKGQTKQPQMIITKETLGEYDTLKGIFEPEGFPKQIAEKFVICGDNENNVKRITLKIKCEKLITAAFNYEQKMVALIVDSINNEDINNKLMELLINSPMQRIDLIKA